MLRLNHLILEDFGPYKGQQIIDFPNEGVVIVYGENMRGKTTLLNAIRYAFFGTVLTRHAMPLSLTNIENWENAKEGKRGFKIILTFNYNNIDYELTRECKLRRGIIEPQSDSDYEQPYFLKRSGVPLSQDEADLELNRVMPESVSRFFLFDGELLQQYEELLRDESEMGLKIKGSIERILGVPVLTTARSNLKRLLDEAQKAESKSAQKHQHTQELGNNHDRLIVERQNHEKELERLKQILVVSKNNKLVIEEEVKKTQRLMQLFSERERLYKEILDIEQKQLEKEAGLKEILSGAWRGVLRNKLRGLLINIESEISELHQKDSVSSSFTYLIELINKGLKENLCPVCDQLIQNPSSINDLKERLTAGLLHENNSERISFLSSQIKLIRSILETNIAQITKELLNNIDEFKMDRHLKKERIEEIDEATKQLDESEHRRIVSDHERVIQDITVTEKGIERQQAELSRVELDIEKIEKKLDMLGGESLGKDRRRRETARHLYDLFNEAVDVYRNELRSKVERDASDLFVNLTTEPEYVGLKINNSYGLSILHSDGAIIPVRSAGAEHIVALSLMGALQKNAPLQGPIIMDSPFGRLDSKHTAKVIESLPNMSDQVMLLVYESEMVPNLARERLLDKLKREYKIVRKTARYSSIEVKHG